MTTQNHDWTLSDAREAAIEAIIENHRYEDETDRILARHDPQDVDTLYPSFEELKERGVNVAALASALENGLDAAAFGKLLADGLDVEAFNQTLESGMDIPTLNGAMENLIDTRALLELHPDPVERALHRHGECSCGHAC